MVISVIASAILGGSTMTNAIKQQVSAHNGTVAYYASLDWHDLPHKRMNSNIVKEVWFKMLERMM
jgi:hypothetical protein